MVMLTITDAAMRLIAKKGIVKNLGAFRDLSKNDQYPFGKQVLIRAAISIRKRC